MSRHNKTDTLRVIKMCQICNKGAVGFHYGAYVCEACKKFFVRHASGICRLYGSCQEKGKCNLNIDGRGKCQHCRFKRCTEVGMNIDSKSSDYDLTSIPCQVCGAKSSGLHFGCITCEGCKGFFRRMIKLKEKLVCFNDNNCKLNLKTRSTCKSCRMNRCLKVGMSRKGIRIGRHTNSLKFTCLKLLTTEKPLDIDSDPESDIEVTTSIKSSHSSKLSKSLKSPISSKASYSSKISSIPKESSSSNSSEESKSDNNSVELEIDVTTCDTVQNNKSPSSEIKLELNLSSEEVIESIQYDQFIQSDTKPHKIDLLLLEQHETLDHSDFKIESNLLLASAFLSQNKLGVNFNQNKKDVLSMNDSRQTVWSNMMDHFVFHSQFIVKFAKLMPGFLHLSLTDKKLIIKDAMYPMILLELSQDYIESTDDVYFNYFDFSMADRVIILTHFPEFKEFSNHVRKSGSLIYDRGLESMDLTLLCGIMMFYNYNSLDNWMYGKSMVLLYQEYLILYFRSHLKLSDAEIILRKKSCIDLIDILNEMNIQHHAIIMNFCASHSEIQYPDLYIEIFN